MSTNTQEQQKTHWRKCDKSDFLGAADLDETHGDLIAMITHVTMEEVNPTGTKKQLRRIAHFKGDLKPMIINVTNGKLLKKWTGSKYIEDWLNIPVSIFILAGVKMGGELTEGIRFRETQPKTTKEELTKDHVRYAKAVEAVKDGNTTVAEIEKVFFLSEDTKKELNSAASIS